MTFYDQTACKTGEPKFTESISFKIIDYLGDDASPVYRVHGPDAQALLEFRIGIDCFDDILAVVEHTFYRDIENIAIL